MHVKQLRRWSILLWQNQVFEGHSYNVFCLKPAIRNDLDKILRMEGIEKGNKEGEMASDTDIPLTYRKLLVMEVLL